MRRLGPVVGRWHRSAVTSGVQWQPRLAGASLSQARNCSSAAAPATPGADNLGQDSSQPSSSKPDHRSIGTVQNLFHTSIYSPGSPLFAPDGTHILNKLISFLRAQYKQFGFREVLTPTIYKKSLWQNSGHWDKYQDDMYEVRGCGAHPTSDVEAETGEDESYGLKPMNCPGHCLLFKEQSWSYRQLPVRYADFSPLHRNEVSGALSGLTRVRRFHQDDGHIFCRPQQIGREIELALKFTDMVLKTFGFSEYRLVLSTRPEKDWLGSLELWDTAEAQLRAALNQSGKPWELNEGDGAFYGPKIDLQVADSLGKFHQLSTIQLDMNLPNRFELKYTVAEGQADYDPAWPENARPVLIHRAIFGSLERFFALLIEKYNGFLPFWLSPRQGIIVTVNQDEDVLRAASDAAVSMSGYTALPEEHSDSASREAINPLSPLDPTFRIDVDSSARSVSKKIREARENKYNIIFVLGPRNLEAGTIDVNAQGPLSDSLPQQDVRTKNNSNRGEAKMRIEDVREWLVDLEKEFK